jgi:hypothetical protein
MPILISLGKTLEEEDWVIDISKGGSAPMAWQKSVQMAQELSCEWTQSNDPGIKCCLEQAKISVDFISLLRWHKCQGSACG